MSKSDFVPGGDARVRDGFLGREAVCLSSDEELENGEEIIIVWDREVRLPGFQDLFGHVPSPTTGGGTAREPRSRSRVNHNERAYPVRVFPPNPGTRFQEHSLSNQQ